MHVLIFANFILDYFSLYQEIKTNYDTLLEQKEQLDREVVIVAKEEMVRCPVL
jgi:hypothetical protein